MALVIKDRVRQTSTTAGTGTITLSGSVTGYQDFTVIGTGNTTYYTIADQSGSNWEVGLGTWTSPDQLSRDTVYESSNGNALVNFGSNIKDVFVTLPAEGFASPPAIGGTTPNDVTATNLTVNTAQVFNTVTVGNSGTAHQIMVDAGDGYDVLDTYMDDGAGGKYPVRFSGGINTYPLYLLSPDYATNYQYIALQPPSGMSSSYTLTLPATAGSNNQILKTDGSGNLSWTGNLVLDAGTATAGTAPLKFTSGTNLTTAEAGAIEYNGTTVFITGTTASGRGVVLAPMMVRLNADRTKTTNDTNLEAIFDSANDTLSLAANTLYYFRGTYILSKSATATAGQLQIGFIFSNTQQDIRYDCMFLDFSSSATFNTIYTTAGKVAAQSGSNTVGSANRLVKFEGWFKSNATTGGTLIPAFTQSVAGTTVAPSAVAGSFIMIQPMSATPSTTLLAGNWS